MNLIFLGLCVLHMTSAGISGHWLESDFVMITIIGIAIMVVMLLIISY